MAKTKTCTSIDFDTYFRRFFQERAVSVRGASIPDDVARARWWCVEYFWKAVSALQLRQHPEEHLPSKKAYDDGVGCFLAAHANSFADRCRALFEKLTTRGSSPWSSNNPSSRMAAHYDDVSSSGGPHPTDDDVKLLADTLIEVRRSFLRSGAEFVDRDGAQAVAVLVDEFCEPTYAPKGAARSCGLVSSRRGFLRCPWSALG